PPPTATYPLSLHDALPIYRVRANLDPPVQDAVQGEAERWARQLFSAGNGASGAQAGSLNPESVRRYFEQRYAIGQEDPGQQIPRSEEHTSELQSPYDLVCR